MKISKQLDDNNINLKLKLILDKIRIERNNQKLSQEDMSNKLGINKAAYNLIENGKQKLPLYEYLKICEILNINFDFWNETDLNNQNSNIENLNINKLIESNLILSKSSQNLSESIFKMVGSNDKLVTINDKNSELIIKLCDK